MEHEEKQKLRDVLENIFHLSLPEFNIPLKN